MKQVNRTNRMTLSPLSKRHPILTYIEGIKITQGGRDSKGRGGVTYIEGTKKKHRGGRGSKGRGGINDMI